jgi:predicted nucleic acid-binding protein
VKVELDASVIVAATRSKNGASRQLLRGALSGRFELLLSVALALEYEAVLKRPQQLAASGGTIAEIDEVLKGLIAVCVPAHRAFFWRPLLPDADDGMVLEAAISGHADCSRHSIGGILSTRPRLGRSESPLPPRRFWKYGGEDEEE